MKKIILLIALALVSTGAWGDYKCTVKSVVEVGDDGVTSTNAMLEHYVGDEFVVDSGTGRMIGDMTNHFTDFTPKVLHSGSNEVPFMALTIYDWAIPDVEYLRIDVKKDRIWKPFMYMALGRIHSGLCEHF